jgi:hypothetical protein
LLLLEWIYHENVANKPNKPSCTTVEVLEPESNAVVGVWTTIPRSSQGVP